MEEMIQELATFASEDGLHGANLIEFIFHNLSDDYIITREEIKSFLISNDRYIFIPKNTIYHYSEPTHQMLAQSKTIGQM